MPRPTSAAQRALLNADIGPLCHCGSALMRPERHGGPRGCPNIRCASSTVVVRPIDHEEERSYYGSSMATMIAAAPSCVAD